MFKGFVKSKSQMLVIISCKLKLFLCKYKFYLLVKQASDWKCPYMAQGPWPEALPINFEKRHPCRSPLTAPTKVTWKRDHQLLGSSLGVVIVPVYVRPVGMERF